MQGPQPPPRGSGSGSAQPPAPEISPADKALLDRWVECKRSRDFVTADRIRGELEAKGIRAEVVRPHVWEPPRSDRVTHGRRHRGIDPFSPPQNSGKRRTDRNSTGGKESERNLKGI